MTPADRSGRLDLQFYDFRILHELLQLQVGHISNTAAAAPVEDSGPSTRLPGRVNKAIRMFGADVVRGLGGGSWR
ncbi:hypothetical protein AB0L06_36170 [Spirillospora sp. NPDC052269]